MRRHISRIQKSRCSATAPMSIPVGGSTVEVRSFDAGPLTSPTLLGRMKCWEDTAAWKVFVDRYQHLLENWSRRRLPNSADVDEVNQQVIWEVARRFSAFQYDPRRSFRGWLRTLHQSRLLDFLKLEKRRISREVHVAKVRAPQMNSARASLEPEVRPLESSSMESSAFELRPPETRSDGIGEKLRRAAEICGTVQSKVNERTWCVFYEIAVDGQSIADTARRHDMKYTSAFAAYSRVCRMLRREAGLPELEHQKATFGESES